MLKKDLKLKNKIKLVIFLIVFCVISIMFIIFSSNNNGEKNVYTPNYTVDGIRGEIIQKNKITEYNKFFTMESIMKKVLDLLYEKDYNTVYDLLDKKFIGNRDKETVIKDLKKYEVLFDSYDKIKVIYLYYLYSYGDNIYVCQPMINNQLVIFLIKIDEVKHTYNIEFIEPLEE